MEFKQKQIQMDSPKGKAIQAVIHFQRVIPLGMLTVQPIHVMGQVPQAERVTTRIMSPQHLKEEEVGAME